MFATNELPAATQDMNTGQNQLRPYPFERLRKLRERIHPPKNNAFIDLSIGEPKHPPPKFITDVMRDSIGKVSLYPGTKGSSEIRNAIATWIENRFKLPSKILSPETQVLPANGTREALFGISQLLVRAGSQQLVGMPNPFYQIYEGAAFLAGGMPYYFDCVEENSFKPNWKDVPERIWESLVVLYICSPGNPSGRVLDATDYEELIRRADKHDFTIIADECYSEIYLDEETPPLGLLQWCAENGRHTFKRCIVMNSLSKRSNVPGLRSGFIAGDKRIIEAFYKYRTYQGGAMPLQVQEASAAAWKDEKHVLHNRQLYRKKIETVTGILKEVLNVEKPQAGFYLWPDVGSDDIAFCETLLSQAGILVLPGQYLARDSEKGNPGRNRVRMALVADEKLCETAAKRIRSLLR